MKTDEQSYYLFDDPSYLAAPFQIKHQKVIRYRLMKGRQQYAQLHNVKIGRKETMEYLEQKNIYLSAQTFDSLFDPTCSRSHIDISAVVALCERYNLDLNQVLAYPEQTSVDTSNATYNEYNGQWSTLTDPNYDGIFYVYFFKFAGVDSSITKCYSDSLMKTEDLIEGTLTFHIDETFGSTAHFSYDRYVASIDNSMRCYRKSATCIPMVSTRNQNVYLNFVDADGQVYNIVFDRQIFHTDKCYFRIASFMVENTEKAKLPVSQKILMFRKKIDPVYYDYLRGLLNMDADNIMISSTMLERLTQNDPEIKAFVDCHQRILEPYHTSVYVFHENLILDTPSNMSISSKKSALIKLRHYSYMPNQFMIGQDQYAHELAKKIQTNSGETNT